MGLRRSSVAMILLLVGLLAEHPAVAANKVMFVTSTMGSGNTLTWGVDAGGQSGLKGADNICQARAHAAGLDTGSRVFRAWLSDDTDDAFCRVRTATGHGKLSGNCGGIPTLEFVLFQGGPWLRTDGYPFS